MMSKLDPPAAAVADELAIRAVIARIAILADEGEPEAYGALFAEDAEWRMAAVPGARAFPPCFGRAAITAALVARRAAGEGGPGTHIRHGLLQSVVELNGDEARARSYMIYLVDLDRAPRIQLMVVYEDYFLRIGGTWKLQSRSIEAA